MVVTLLRLTLHVIVQYSVANLLFAQCLLRYRTSLSWRCVSRRECETVLDEPRDIPWISLKCGRAVDYMDMDIVTEMDTVVDTEIDYLFA